ncbi:hypothetical protein [Staphylococcus pseudintermedius]|uniref:hypothetical protein n=1 Tax=Staphylococcus pseudintermedius TaxID=283734 RepID=UPI002920D3C5|nr:hypothetical protein QS421_11810 [Staphylococcus pseudintermedius]
MLNHDKLMYLFERHVQDKSISTFIRRSLQVGAIDLSGDNIEKAIKKVKKNKGAPGIDGMKVSELHAHFAQYFSRITKKLLDGS